MCPHNSARDVTQNKSNSKGGDWMKKKATIVISLVEESAEKAKEEIEKEIYEALTKEPALIPWLAKVEKVTVTEA
jgi:3-methyladenine DNA glycosylase/8-oxoguanine DNA glycosylase